MVKRILALILVLVAFVIALSIFAALYTGLDQFTLYGMVLERWNLAYLLIAFVIVLLVCKTLVTKNPSSIVFLHPCMLLFCTVLVVYLSNGVTVSAGDTRGARYLPLSILRDGDFYLDEFSTLFSKRTPHFVRKVHRHFVSDYPVGAPLAALPVYLISAIGPVSPTDPLLIELEKISGALLVSFSVVMMYLVLRFYTSPRFSFFLALVFGLCTSNLSVNAQGAWQHGPSQLSILCALYCILRGKNEPHWLPPSAFFLSFSVVCRPTDILIALPIAIFVLFRHPKQAFAFIAFGVPPALFLFWYNITYFGDPFRTQFSIVNSWTTPFGVGITGILFSPGRGLFFYSPVFLFSIIGILHAWRMPRGEQNRDALLITLSFSLFLILALYSKWEKWWGGEIYGPRIISDINPILILFLVPARELLARVRMWKVVFVAAVVWSCYTHAIGAYLHDMNWYVRYNHYPIPQRFWLWDENPVFSDSIILFDHIVGSPHDQKRRR